MKEALFTRECFTQNQTLYLRPKNLKKANMAEEIKERSNNFIENIIEEDLAGGFSANNLRFRFPPEPNGYLHLSLIHI